MNYIDHNCKSPFLVLALIASLTLMEAGVSVPDDSGSHTLGTPLALNTTAQYQLAKVFWPEVEVNYTYWPNGTHAGWNQVMLTPGLILGRFQIANDTPTRPVNLIIGAGYQVAVTPNPVTQNNFVAVSYTHLTLPTILRV